MTEEQRRALFALREALRLCSGSNIVIDAAGVAPLRLWVGVNVCLLDGYLGSSDIDRLLSEHPE